MQWQDTTGYLVKTFWDPDGNGLPNIDIARNIAFTGVTFLLGWLTSLGGQQRRLKSRIINELILAQSELRTRAYPKVWRQNDVRESWMLDPFVARLRFLYADLNERKSLSGKQLTLIDNYIARVEEFIAKWSETMTRHEGYHYAYGLTYHAMRAAAKSLGLKENARFAGLNSPKDGLFGGSPPSGSAPVTPQSPSPPPSMPGLVPAE